MCYTETRLKRATRMVVTPPSAAHVRAPGAVLLQISDIYIYIYIYDTWYHSEISTKLYYILLYIYCYLYIYIAIWSICLNCLYCIYIMCIVLSCFHRDRGKPFQFDHKSTLRNPEGFWFFNMFYRILSRAEYMGSRSARSPLNVLIELTAQVPN